MKWNNLKIKQPYYDIISLFNLTPQYIVDKAGKKTGVILDIVAFEQLLEAIEDIYFGSIAHKVLQEEDEYITHLHVKKSCRKIIKKD